MMFQSAKQKKKSRRRSVDTVDETSPESNKPPSRRDKERKSSKVKNFFRRLSLNVENGTSGGGHPEDYDVAPYDNNVDDLVEEIKRAENRGTVSSFQIGKESRIPETRGETTTSPPPPVTPRIVLDQPDPPDSGDLSLQHLGRTRCHSIDSIKDENEVAPPLQILQDTKFTPVYNYRNPASVPRSSSLGGTADVAGLFIHRVGHQLPASQLQETVLMNETSSLLNTDRVLDNLQEDAPYENVIVFDDHQHGYSLSQDSVETMDVLDRMKQASLLRGHSLDGSIDDVTYEEEDTFIDDSFEDAGDSCDDLLEPGPYENIDYDEDSGTMEPMDKLHHIVHEIMTTEEVYVKRLEILNKAKTESEKLFDKEIANQMFPYIDGIYMLHKENMLPHIQERVKAWRTNKRIGDIMKRFTPFLKLYTDYVKNFDNALSNVESWNEKSQDFRNLLVKLQSKGPSMSMKVQIKSHMLEPVQRVPRYELLLKEYLKNLPTESLDREDTESAITSVVEASRQFEQIMKIESKMGQLVQLERQISSPVSLLQTSRELIKQGKINKVCATSGKVVNRFLFLFNDILLICTEQTFTIAGLYPKYKVRQLMEIDGMQIVEGTSSTIPYTFYVKTRKKAIELCARDEDERGMWHQTLWKVVADRMRDKVKSKNSVSRKKTIRKTFINDDALGKQAPVWIHNTQVSQCMLCALEFRAFRKKHHCRACGCVVCSKCSLRSAMLPYDDMRPHKVCDGCYLILSESPDTTLAKTGIEHFKRRSRVVCSISGYLQASQDDGRVWDRRWLELHEGGVLFGYKAEQDVRPLYSLEIKNTNATLISDGKENSSRMLRIDDAQTQSRYLYRDTDNEISRWFDAIKTELGSS